MHRVGQKSDLLILNNYTITNTIISQGWKEPSFLEKKFKDFFLDFCVQI